MNHWAYHNLHIFYCDRFSLYRSHWENDEQGIPWEVVDAAPLWENVPCYLSMNKNSLGVAGRLDHPRADDSHGNVVEQAFLVFCGRECPVEAGDILSISHCGIVGTYVAGEPHRYPSHQEFLVYRKEEA